MSNSETVVGVDATDEGVGNLSNHGTGGDLDPAVTEVGDDVKESKPEAPVVTVTEEDEPTIQQSCSVEDLLADGLGGELGEFIDDSSGSSVSAHASKFFWSMSFQFRSSQVPQVLHPGIVSRRKAVFRAFGSRAVA
jgi:hypothetical protein